MLLSGRLSAQVTYGINGTVTDIDGAAIPGATVQAKDISTNIVSRATTSAAGSYSIILAEPGDYSVTVTAKGFKRWTQTNVTVEIGRFSTVAATMAPGAASETVHVIARATSLNTADPGITTTLSPALVRAAPVEVNGGPRRIDSFILDVPGAGQPNNVGAEGRNGAFNIDGGITAESSYYYNGVPVSNPNVAPNFAQPIYPPYEMINQFSIASSTFSAQYGLAQGVITYKTASGTNQFHGDAFDILRNSFFDSDGFFPSNFNAAGKPVPPVNHQNDWGFTLSGPITIPQVYNGKNRSFFLFSLDWYGQNGAQTAFGTVPTMAERTGDFSNYRNAAGQQIPIFNPVTGQQFDYDGKLNVIPPSMISPISESVLHLIPAPNRPGIVFGQQQNELPAVKSVLNFSHNWGFSLDQKLSESKSIHFSFWNTRFGTNSLGSNIVPASNPLQQGEAITTDGSGYLLNYIDVISPRLVMTAGVAKIDADYGEHDMLTGTSFAGVQGSNTFPGLKFDGQNASSGWGTQLTQNNSRQIDISLVNNWLWTVGHNNFNIGGVFFRTLQNTQDCSTCGARINFSHNETSTPDASNPDFGSDGSSFASFLLGTPDQVLREFSPYEKLRNMAVSPYIQDSYQVNNRLTINVGLRWDVMVPTSAKGNNIAFANFSEPNPAANGLLGAVTMFGNCNYCTHTRRADIHWGNFGPRFGFSYMVNNSTVIQGGFYRTTLSGGAYAMSVSRIAQQYGNLLAGSYQSGSTGTNRSSYGSWDALAIPQPTPVTFNPSIGNAQLVRQMDPRTAGIAPYSQQWTLGVQRQLPWNMFATVNYIGNRDIHLPSSLNQPNQLPVADLHYGNLLGDLVTSPAAMAAGIQIPYPNFVQEFGGGASVEQALLPFPQFAGTDNHFDMNGSSFYNAIQLNLTKRFTNNISFLTNFTLGRNDSNVDYGVTLQQNNPINTFNQKAEWSASLLNQKWAYNFIGTYKLPFGLGQRFLNSNGVMSRVLGDWQVAGILNYAAGNPIGLEQNNVVLMATNANGDGQNRPNIVPGVKRKTFSYNLTKDFFEGKIGAQPVQFTTDAFTPSPQYGLGDAARNYASLTSPPLAMEDFDATKSFRVGEGITASLRVDYFNAFNRTQLELPDNDISDSTFGMVTSQRSQISNRQGQASFRLQF